MHCPYCKVYLGEAYYEGYHYCPNEPPTNWLNVFKWIGIITVTIFLVW